VNPVQVPPASRPRSVTAALVTVPARHGNKCLDVLNAATTDGAQVVQWTCGTGGNQQWQRSQV
jgi:alpha-galactosidase